MNPRDVKLKLASQQSQKQDKRERYRAVLCAADGSRTTGSVWADEMSKRVYFQFFGSGGVGRARCEKIVPQLGLGVYVGKTDDGLEWQVLEDDPFLRQTATDSRNYQATAPADLQPGGRLFMWLYPKAISPLATYPATIGLTVNVVAGDYPYGGTRKTFAGQNSVDLSASQPASGNHRYVGLYLDAANTLQTVDGTAVAVAADPVEPTWPAGAFRLSVVRIANPQTSIVFGHDDSTANDILDRRMVWSDEQAGGGGWPFAHVLTVSTTDTDADYDNLPDALAGATAGDAILLDAETFTLASSLAFNKALTVIGQGPGFTIITCAASNAPSIDVTANGVTFRNLTLRHTGGGSTSGPLSTDNTNLTLDNVTLEKTSGAPTTGYGLWMYGGSVTLKNGTKITCTSGTDKYGIYNTTATATMTVWGGEIGGTTFDIFGDQAGSTITLAGPVLANNLISFSGSLLGAYFNSVGQLFRLGIGVAAYHSTTQTLVNGSAANAMALDSERRDDAGFHDNVTNNTRLTVPAGYAGWYVISGGIGFPADSTGTYRQTRIRLNGSTIIAANQQIPSAAQILRINISTLYYLEDADYVELVADHNASTNLTSVQTANANTEFRMVREG